MSSANEDDRLLARDDIARESGTRIRTFLALAMLAMNTFAVEPATSSPAEEYVIQVEVVLERDSLAVVSLMEALSWTEDLLPRKPQLTSKNWMRLDHDQSEILAAFYDVNGRVLKTYAFPGRPITFLETLEVRDSEDRSATFHGGLGTPSRDVRMFFVPVPKNAHYILFYRTEVLFEPPNDDLESRNRDRFQVFTSQEIRADRGGLEKVGTFGWNLIGRCHLPRQPRDRPGPDWTFRVPLILKKPGMGPPWELIPDWAWLEIGKILCAPGPGEVFGHSQLNAAMRRVDKRPFNIVIYGDGFANTAQDINTYKTLASLAVDAFRNTPPYSNEQRNMNIWRIDTRSLTSGIANCTGVYGTNCPDPRLPPETYYKITGCMPVTHGIPACSPSYGGYLGPTTLCPFDDAAQQELPRVFVDLRLVIANCPPYGGAAYPTERLVVVPTCANLGADQEAYFKELVLHESAHVIGRVCDEYWVCVKWQGETFPNFATLDDVNTGNVPWKSLDPMWSQSKHILGTPPCLANGTDHNFNLCYGYNVTPPISASLHGAFWGCQFIDPASVDATHCCNWSCAKTQTDPLGSPYFRPSPRCKMKELGQNFCIACTDAIGSRISNPPNVLLP
jgi:hypothetical protein